MSTRINTNVDAFGAQRNMALNAMNYSKSVEKLSSGLRINRAGDDAAGLSISEKLRGQIKGLAQAQRNSQDGVSLIQTAEGALNETHSILQRMRELAVQASNGTLTSNDQTAISTELTQLGAEIDRIGNTTQFNSKSLLDNGLNTTVSSSSGVLQGVVGASSGAVLSNLNVTNATASHSFQFSGCTTTGALTLTDCSTGVAQTITVAAITASTATNEVLNFSSLGVSMTLSGCSSTTTAANLVSDYIGVSGTGKTIATGTSGGAVTFQIGSNYNQTMSVGIADARSAAIGTTSTYSSLNNALTAFNTAVGNGTAGTAAQNLLQSVDQAVTDVSNVRSTLGAAQNRLEHTISNLGVAQENLTASESRIRDVDMAAEMVNFTKTGILQQAGQAILAQANQAPSGILALLR